MPTVLVQVASQRPTRRDGGQAFRRLCPDLNRLRRLYARQQWPVLREPSADQGLVSTMSCTDSTGISWSTANRAGSLR